MSKALLKHYEASVDESNNCCRLIVAALNESYQWLVQSIGESSYRDLADNYEFSCLNDLIKASIEVNSNGVRIRHPPSLSQRPPLD